MLEFAYIVLIISTALVMGNEFSVAFFIHPSLSRAGHQRFIPAIQVFARLFGRVMPLWMTGTLLLHLALAWAEWTSHPKAALCTLYAAAVWIIVAVFSVIFPVPHQHPCGEMGPFRTSTRLGVRKKTLGSIQCLPLRWS